jgi:hypothetical protein
MVIPNDDVYVYRYAPVATQRIAGSSVTVGESE